MYKRLWDAKWFNTCSTSSIDSDVQAVPFIDKVIHRWYGMTQWHIYWYMRSLIFHSVLRTPTRTRFVPSTWFWSRITTNIFGFQAPGRTGSIGDLSCYQRILGEHDGSKVGWGFTNKNITKSVPYDAARRSTTTRTALALCNSWKESLEVLEKWINMTDCAKDCSDDVDIFSDIG